MPGFISFSSPAARFHRPVPWPCCLGMCRRVGKCHAGTHIASTALWPARGCSRSRN